MRCGTCGSYLHRFLTGAKKGQVVDHINGDPLDNRRANLRFVTVKQNNRNSKKSRGGFRRRGVVPEGRKWRAAISITVSSYKEAVRIREAWEEAANWHE